MKYLVGTHSDGTSGEAAVFAVTGENAVNLTALDASVGADLMALIARPDLAESLAEKLADAPKVAVSSITPALPVAAPGTIICMGLNYTDHIKEGGYDIPEYPALFMRGKNSIMAAGRAFGAAKLF